MINALYNKRKVKVCVGLSLHNNYTDLRLCLFHYLTRIPSVAPTSGESKNGPSASLLAANTMPSLIPNFILRGAKLATITVYRPIKVAGS